MAKTTKANKAKMGPKKQNWFIAMALWKKIALALAAVVIIFVILVNMATSPSVKVSNDFVNYMQADNAKSAYNLMSKEAQGTISESDFKAIIDQISPILNTKESMKSKKVMGETGASATAEVVYEIKGTDGITYTLTNNLIKENGQWKIQNFESKRK